MDEDGAVAPASISFPSEVDRSLGIAYSKKVLLARVATDRAELSVCERLPALISPLT